ncbi:MAG: FtsX-like permease family protein [Scytonema sp. PMC 1069.18]|nr:FtsX-like permease family protein [Scytonema sp. PMC 1069.18]MEC4888305.1 FtsX-like permease family protein [Scytonema sp. PMC 1070.18]
MPSIARKNLLEDIPRFLVAQAGIMFAVCLVTIQTGLQYGFARSSSQLITQSRADIWVASQNMQHIGLTTSISYKQVTEARNVEGVAQAEGIIISGGLWHEQESDDISSITVVGAQPGGLLFPTENMTQGSFNDLKQPYRFILDKTSLQSLRLKNLGEVGEINNIPAKLIGFTQGTQSIIFGALLFTSLESANTYINYGSERGATTNDSGSSARTIASTDPISYVLIRAQPGQNIQQLKRRLENNLPNIRAYTREEMAEVTQNFWQERSGIGFVLGIGAVVGVVVGAVVVSQILYASVTDHIKEFGTLKAMGASDWFIYGVIIEQGLWMAILGYIPGMVICLGVAAWTATSQGIVILITPLSAVAVLGITAVMCIGSAVFAIQKVTRVDPAIVFKG